MPRTPNRTFRATVYQLETQLRVDKAIRPSYLGREGFHSDDELAVAGRPAALVWGLVQKSEATWVSPLQRWLGASEDPAFRLGNATASAVLLVPTKQDDRIWALCFGMGFQMIDPGRIVPGLGRQLAVRTADPDRLRSITHTRLDQRALISRTSIPAGDALMGFGASELGDLISRVVGPARLVGTVGGATGQAVEIRGADALNVPLGRDARELIQDLDTIEALLALDPQPELAIIEQLVALRKADTRVAELDSRLDGALSDPDGAQLGLAWPTELADEAVPIDHFLIEGAPRGTGRRGPQDASLESILGPLGELPPGERVARLDRMRVMAMSQEGDPASNNLPARKWITYETTMDTRRYCLHDGRWYSVDEGLEARHSQLAAELYAKGAPLPELPPWAEEQDEEAYNRVLADELGGVCLDRKLVVCESHPRKGFEACDVLTPTGVLVHVKLVDKSAPASHLFAQAGVSNLALGHDATARLRLREIVAEQGGDPEWVPDKPVRVVLVMANRRLLGPADLFSFARMRLLRLAQECTAQGVDLSVVPTVRASSAFVPSV